MGRFQRKTLFGGIHLLASSWSCHLSGSDQGQGYLSKADVCLDGAIGLPKGIIATQSVNCISPGQAKSKLPVQLRLSHFPEVDGKLHG